MIKYELTTKNGKIGIAILPYDHTIFTDAHRDIISLIGFVDQTGELVDDLTGNEKLLKNFVDNQRDYMIFGTQQADNRIVRIAFDISNTPHDETYDTGVFLIGENGYPEPIIGQNAEFVLANLGHEKKKRYARRQCGLCNFSCSNVT